MKMPGLRFDPCFGRRPAGLILALLVVVLVAGACAQAPMPTAAPSTAPTQAAAPTTSAPTASAATAAAPTGGAELPAGVDAQGNFYRGDPNASVKLVEWSDFQ